AGQRCEAKSFVYDRRHESTRGHHCEFAPQNWWRISEACKDLRKNRPSPISIPLGVCKTKSKNLKNITLGRGWSRERDFIVKNNGHS
uniref:Kringle domain-containing protein n=1 Tax=Macrostomum lignano TaxID=282301 RepID=A0A1I8G9Z6_9PLAT